MTVRTMGRVCAAHGRASLRRSVRTMGRVCAAVIALPLLAGLTAASAAVKPAKKPQPAQPVEVVEEVPEEKETRKNIFEFLLREEPGYGNPRSDSLLNPDDILGTPRFQNRVLGSIDAKLPIVQGSGVNPVAELVVADTFVYLQNEGSEPTPAKPQITDARNFLKEAYVNLRPTGSLLLTVGRRNLTDGVGYSRNPVDFMANATTLPGNNFDNRYRLKNREGSILARAEYLWQGGAVSYMYAPTIGQSEVSDAKIRTELDRLTQFNREQAHWLKIYQYVGGFDISLHYFYKTRHNAGLAVAKVFGDALELHAEGRVQRGSSVLSPYKASEDVYFGPMLVAPERYSFESRSDDALYVRSLIGGQYTFENKLNLSVEYYYNGEGYSASQLNTLYNGLELAGSRHTNSSFVLPQGNPYRLFLLAANLNYNFLSMGQHYSFVRLSDPEFFKSNKWEAAAYGSVSLADGSGIAAADLTYKINDRFSVQALVNGFFGRRRSEGGLFYQGFSTLVALEAQF